MISTTQLPLPWETLPQLGRADFIAAPGNSAALAFIDAWPNWPSPAAALHGPAASGKSHLVAIWRAHANAKIFNINALTPEVLSNFESGTAVVVEDADHLHPSLERDRALIALLDRMGGFLLLTGRSAPKEWTVVLPDLASRLAATPDFALGAPDETLLRALAAKLLADRQLIVPEAVVTQMLNALERSPSAIRDFIEKLDTYALSLQRKISPQLIRDLLAENALS